jgi:hypothetical protein
VNEFPLCSLRFYEIVGAGTYELPRFIHREFTQNANR